LAGKQDVASLVKSNGCNRGIDTGAGAADLVLPNAIAAGIEFDNETIEAADIGHGRQRSKTNGAIEGPGQGDIAAAIHRQANRPLLGGVPEQFGPKASSGRIVLGQEDIVVAGTGDGSAGEVKGASGLAGDDNVARAVHGDGVEFVVSRGADGLDPGGGSGSAVKLG